MFGNLYVTYIVIRIELINYSFYVNKFFKKNIFKVSKIELKLKLILENIYLYIMNYINEFMNFYLRIVHLPSVFVTKNLYILITIFLCYTLTILYINNIFDIHMPNLIKFSLIGYPYVSVNNLLIGIVLITSTYTKFNLFLRLINLIRSFTYIPEFWKGEKKLILGYIIYSSVLGFISYNLILRIDSMFLNLDVFFLYLIMSILVSIVMTMYRTDIISQQFNKNKNLYNKIGKSILKFSLFAIFYFFILYLYITKISPAIHCDGDRSRIITRSDSEYDSDSSNPPAESSRYRLIVRGERTMTRMELDRQEEEVLPVVDPSIPRLIKDSDTIHIDTSVPVEYKPWYYIERTNTYDLKFFYNWKIYARTQQLKERALLLGVNILDNFKAALYKNLRGREDGNELITTKFLDEVTIALQGSLDPKLFPNIGANGVAPSPFIPGTPVNSSSSSLSTIDSLSSNDR